MPRGTPDPASYLRLSLTGLSPSLAGFPKTVLLGYCQILRSLPRCARTPVWALPISLAATLGIDVSSFSSGYLDVSVPRVPLHALWIYAWIPVSRWVSPFRHPRLDGYLRLPGAFRSLSRLSSALSAKASTLRSFLFDLPYACVCVCSPCRFLFPSTAVSSATLLLIRYLLKDNSSDVFFLSLTFLSLFLDIRICGFQGTYLAYSATETPDFSGPSVTGQTRLPGSLIKFLIVWQPPALPHRLQCSTIGRLRLNHRVRDGYGCVP